MDRQYEPRVLAHAKLYKRVTITALRRLMKLQDVCELCGAPTSLVAFFESNQFAEVCIACAAEANLNSRNPFEE